MANRMKNRHSTRLANYDYSLPGVYFITLCTHARKPLFGKIINDEICLNAAGQIVMEEWLRTSTIRPELDTDEFVIMPNHIHGIVVINDSIGAHSRAPLQDIPQRKPLSLGSFVAGFKSIVTKRINNQRGTPGHPIWQRNYYDHIIRSEKELDQIRAYIANKTP